MSDTTKIEWADSTFNPWIGCTKVGPGCDHCYAEANFDLRRNRVKWGFGNPRSRTSEANWKKPLQWDRHHAEFFSVNGRRRRVFCASLADVFDNEVDDLWRVDLFQLIAATPNLDWMLLTKRIGNVATLAPRLWMRDGFPHQVMIGATICNQDEANRDIPKLLRIPARVRFLSMEPLLERVDLCETLGMWWNQTMECFESLSASGFNRNPNNQAEKAIHWVIAGGESGPKARPMHPGWARSLRDQCAAAHVAFLFKQWGEWLPYTQNNCMLWRMDANGAIRIGKKLAGRLLDGVEHNGYPEPPL